MFVDSGVLGLVAYLVDGIYPIEQPVIGVTGGHCDVLPLFPGLDVGRRLRP